MTLLEEKQRKLEGSLRAVDSLLVAYSGGVDSSYLAFAAHRVLGAKMLAVTALSPSYSESDRLQAAEIVRRFGIPHEFVRTEEVQNPAYRANNPDRCYFCKDELFSKLDALVQERKFSAVAYGMNVEDQGDWRPGQRAAHEHRVLAPLFDAGLKKVEIRELARRAELPVWDRPASACLSSRIAYGVEVTPERLSVVEKGEEALRSMGFRQFRVRHHDDIVRIEISPEELPRALRGETAKKFVEIFKSLGFKFVTLDLEGYRQGSLNLVHLAENPPK